MFWVIGGALEAFCNQSCMLLWMKATKRYSVEDNNDYPLGVTAIGPCVLIEGGLSQYLIVGIFATLTTAVLIDTSDKHMPWGFLACGLQIVACIILIIRVIPDGAVFAGYCECWRECAGVTR